MQVFLDDNVCECEACSVGDAIAAAAALAETNGRLIIEVEVDGAAWTDHQLDRREQLASMASEVRLTSAEPRALVAQTLNDAAEALHEAGLLQTEAAELIQSDEHASGMNKLQEAIAIWMGVQQAVTQGTALAGVDLDEVRIGQTTAPSCIERLNTQLAALRTHLEAGDHLGLADTLLYELPHITDEWRELLDCLQQRVKGD